jgi:hypothetical protein
LALTPRWQALRSRALATIAAWEFPRVSREKVYRFGEEEES